VIVPPSIEGFPSRPLFARYSAGTSPQWIGWATEKAARRHVEELRGFGYNVEGWEVMEEGDWAGR
jgi:hypothetical protein